MIRRSLQIAVCIVVIVLATSALASNGTQVGTVGARATAMGGSFRGLADDWTAMFYNPGGLTQLGDWTFSASTALILPRAEMTPHTYTILPFSGITTPVREATERNFFVPAAAVFYRHSESLVFGLGVYAPFGLGTEWDLMALPAGYGNALSEEKEHYSDHQVLAIQPTVAYRLSERVSVGLGVSYIYGKMTLDNVKLPFNPAVGVWPMMQERADLLGLGLTDLTPDQYRIALENHLDGDGSAFGFNFGLHVALSEKFSVGLSGRVYTNLWLKGKFRQVVNAYGDAAKVGTLAQIPVEFYADGDDPTGSINKLGLMALFSGQDLVTTDASEAEAELPLPMTLGFGLAYKFSERFAVTADVSWTNWAAWDEVSIEEDEEELGGILLDWSSTIEAGFGFEWMCRRRERSQWFWRGGFYTVDSPVGPETLTPTILDPARRYVVTTGIGLTVGRVSFDLAYEYIWFDEPEIPFYSFHAVEGYAENWAGAYEAQSHVITLGTSVAL